MNTIQIDVSRQMGGFVFSISPLMERQIRQAFPEFQPIECIFVNGTNNDFGQLQDRLEKHIFPALIGVEGKNSLKNKVKQVLFVETRNHKALHTIEI
jgi:hypothetical protein